MWPWRTFSSYLRRRFGAPVRKLPVDGGFTCPNRDGTKGRGGCAFCNNRAFSPAVRERTGDFRARTIADQVKEALKRFPPQSPTRFIVYFQAFSNTYAPPDVLEERYREALCDPRIVGLAVGTRPDCVDEATLDVLSSFADRFEVWLELGLQTIHDDILQAVNRGHDSRSFFKAVELASKRPLKICVHIMIGLPGDSRERNRNTALALAPLPYHGLKLHPLQVLRDTAFEREYRSGKLPLISEEEYVVRAADFLERTPRDVVIQRLTADALGDTLLAPAWCAGGGERLRRLIAEELNRRGTRQGSRVTTELMRMRGGTASS